MQSLLDLLDKIKIRINVHQLQAIARIRYYDDDRRRREHVCLHSSGERERAPMQRRDVNKPTPHDQPKARLVVGGGGAAHAHPEREKKWMTNGAQRFPRREANLFCTLRPRSTPFPVDFTLRGCMGTGTTRKRYFPSELSRISRNRRRK